MVDPEPLDITCPDADGGITLSRSHCRWWFVGLGGAGANVCDEIEAMCRESGPDGGPCPIPMVRADHPRQRPAAACEPSAGELVARASRLWRRGCVDTVVLLAALGDRTGGRAAVVIARALAEQRIAVRATVAMPFRGEATWASARAQLAELAACGCVTAVLYNDDIRLLPAGTTVLRAFRRANRVLARAAVLGVLTGSHTGRPRR